MNLNTTQDIQSAADSTAATVFEQGLGLFGSPDDARLLDEVVRIAYEERRRRISPGSTVSGII